MYKEELAAVESGSRKTRRVVHHPLSGREQSANEKAIMKAVVIDRFGPPAAMHMKEVPIPEPGPREVLIQLHSAGVGVWDADMRGGWWPEGRPEFPLVLGTDGAGIVAGKGASIRKFGRGDRVWAYEFTNPKGGFYAEYVAVDAEHVGFVPRSLDLLQAGAGLVTGLTALQGITTHLRVHAGETILIFGASGAVGTLAVQFAKALRARVIGSARGPDAEALVHRLGAREIIDPGNPRLEEQLRRFAPKGLDSVLALAGGQGLERCLELVRPGGRVAYPHGVEPEPRPRPNVRLVPYDAQASPRHFATLARVIDGAHIQVPIAASYPLEQASKAHERLEKGRVLGRIAFRIRE